METTDKSGRIKLTVDLEINQPTMELIKDNMDNMINIASQMRPMNSQGGKAKMYQAESEGHHSKIH
ncbi:MAG: hypothetical protein WC046_03005 [Candidatus Bathyarchaeia archaeon]